MKPHGRDCPDRCSICIGATPRRVDVIDGQVLLDDVPERPADPGAPLGMKPRRRGGGKR